MYQVKSHYEVRLSHKNASYESHDSESYQDPVNAFMAYRDYSKGLMSTFGDQSSRDDYEAFLGGKVVQNRVELNYLHANGGDEPIAWTEYIGGIEVAQRGRHLRNNSAFHNELDEFMFDPEYDVVRWRRKDWLTYDVWFETDNGVELIEMHISPSHEEITENSVAFREFLAGYWALEMEDRHSLESEAHDVDEFVRSLADEEYILRAEEYERMQDEHRERYGVPMNIDLNHWMMMDEVNRERVKGSNEFVLGDAYPTWYDVHPNLMKWIDSGFDPKYRPSFTESDQVSALRSEEV